MGTNYQIMRSAISRFGLSESHRVPMLEHAGKVGGETRRLYFALALNSRNKLNVLPQLRGSSRDEAKTVQKMLPVTRILSFGRCNVNCPYCKRDCQFISDAGLPISAVDVPLSTLFEIAEDAHARGETIRFSGGDPVMFPREPLALATYMAERHGAAVSIAHNGTGPGWVRKMLPFLSSAAIDLKGTPEAIGRVMGISNTAGPRMFALSNETQRLIAGTGSCFLDVRTPIFGHTTLNEMLRLAEHVTLNDRDTTFWTWRMYKSVVGCSWEVPDKLRVFEMMAEVSARFPQHWLGVRAKWERGGMVYFLNGEIVNQEDVTSAEDDDSENHLNYEHSLCA